MVLIRAGGPCALAIILLSGMPVTGAAQASRRVEGRTLHSTAHPALRLELAEAFTFAGHFPFRIGDLALGERFVFVDAAGDSIRRVVVAHFEEIGPEQSERFNYSFEGAPEAAGYRWRTNPFAFSHEAARRQAPDGEASRTEALLRSRGLQVPDEVMTIRRLTVPDAERRRELIIFYLEPLRESGLTLDRLAVQGQPSPEWLRVADELRLRAEASYRLLPSADQAG